MKKSSTLMFMMNISFVPSICNHRSTIFIFNTKKISKKNPKTNKKKKTSTHFLTIVKNLTFPISPTVSVCVCVCVCVCVDREREREREREGERESGVRGGWGGGGENCILSQTHTHLPQNTSISTPNCLCSYFQIYDQII